MRERTAAELLELEPAAGDRELDQVDTMRIKAHRDNWSDLTVLERAGVRVDRARYQDVAVDLKDPEVRAELVGASARKAIEVDASAREQLEAHGLTVTAAGAVIKLEQLEPRELEHGEQLAEGDLPAGAGERIDQPEHEDDDQGDDDQGDGDELEPVSAGPAPAAGRRGRKGKGRARGGRA